MKHRLPTELAVLILDYVGGDSLAEALAIVEEAYSENPVAEYIAAAALERVDEEESQQWLRKSASKRFRPALIREALRMGHSPKKKEP